MVKSWILDTKKYNKTIYKVVFNLNKKIDNMDIVLDIIDKMINIPELNTPDRKTTLKKPPKIIRKQTIKKKLNLNK